MFCVTSNKNGVFLKITGISRNLQLLVEFAALFEATWTYYHARGIWEVSWSLHTLILQHQAVLIP